MLFRGPILWKSLNNQTRDLDNEDKFKLALKKRDLVVLWSDLVGLFKIKI